MPLMVVGNYRGEETVTWRMKPTPVLFQLPHQYGKMHGALPIVLFATGCTCQLCRHQNRDALIEKMEVFITRLMPPIKPLGLDKKTGIELTMRSLSVTAYRLIMTLMQ